MKCELTLKIRDLHACPGDGPPKIIEVPKDILTQIDVTTVKSEVEKELSREKESAETKDIRRIEKKPLYAFREENGTILFRLGGSYGKLMGLFREVGSLFYSQKVKGFKSSYKPFLKSILIRPQWVTLDLKSEAEIVKIPQMLAGRGNRMILQYYEKIPLCHATVNIQLPDEEKEKFEKILEQAEGMPFGPKRRGELTVHEIKWI